ncbi:MAG: hypothetical protein ABJQ93_07880 [Luteolibacter sp.]
MRMLLWMLAAAGLGVGLTFVPWGDPGGFHGVGFPFAKVYWDDGRDFPNPFAIFMNSVACLAVVLLVFFFIKCKRPTKRL